METLLFARSDVAARLDMGACIQAVENAFGLLGRGEAEPPATMGMHTATGSFHIKAGLLERNGRAYFVAKTNGNFPGNRAAGLPTIQGLAMLCDAGNGRVLAIFDSIELTALRTGAATAVAARYLARPASAVAALCGCGRQADAQLRALCEVLPIREALVYDVDAAAAQRFAAECSLPNVRLRVASGIGAALQDADVCVTCTTSAEFLVAAEMVRPGTFVAGVGVDNEHKRELAPGLLAAATVVTDLRTQCAQIGDLHHAIAAGVMSEDGVHADLGDIVAGKRAGRESDGEITVFDSTGIALQDVAAAVAIYESAAGSEAVGAIRRFIFSD
jgi:ornithine cyclodeaminase/alanine dehydrogenase-like protein (mu-crystallin family)